MMLSKRMYLFHQYKPTAQSLLFLMFILFFSTSSFLFAKEKYVKVLVLKQQSDGFPGAKNSDSMIPQTVYIYKNMMIIQDLLPTGMVRIIRLDKQLIWELNPLQRMYTTTLFSKFQDMAKKREINREKLRQRILETSLSANKKKEALKVAGLTKDGIDIIQTIHSTKKNKIGKFNCEKWQVKKNNKVILESWTTKDVSFPPTLLKFYKDLGIFTPQEIKGTEKIPNFPIRSKIWIDFGLKGNYIITTIVSNVEILELNRKIFDLPPTYKKYSPPKPKKICPLCGKKVISKKNRVVWKRKIYYTCSRKHQIRWMIKCARRGK